MKVAAVLQIVLDVPDGPSATAAATDHMSALGLACRVVNAWRVDVQFTRLRGMKRGCTATIVEVCAGDDTVAYRYDDSGSTYRVPRDWFTRAFRCDPTPRDGR